MLRYLAQIAPPRSIQKQRSPFLTSAKNAIAFSYLHSKTAIAPD
ncbi:hypothetical protein [Microcystis aeruginosa]|nr:hypothetical protein [Microcystis aeruginosa]